MMLYTQYQRSQDVFWNVSVLKIERLGLESLGKWNVSVLRVQCPGLVSVLSVWKNGTSRSHLGLEGWLSQFCNLVSCGHPRPVHPSYLTNDTFHACHKWLLHGKYAGKVSAPSLRYFCTKYRGSIPTRSAKIKALNAAAARNNLPCIWNKFEIFKETMQVSISDSMSNMICQTMSLPTWMTVKTMTAEYLLSKSAGLHHIQ